MKIIIAGGRDYTLSPFDLLSLENVRPLITEVVCGMATGADTEGKNWAESNNIPVIEFPADWKKFGRGAGHIRNKKMAVYADGVILFAGGNGTENMFKIAKTLGLVIWDFRDSSELDEFGLEFI